MPQAYKSYLDAGIDARPTIAITRAHIKLNDFDEAVRAGELEVDGKVVVRTPTDWINQNRAESAAAKTARSADDVAAQHMSHAQFDAGVEINVSKVACEPVWYLPGVAERFGVSEGTLRRALFEETGGMYPELLTRHDLKTFLPPIGGLTVYIVRTFLLLSVTPPERQLTCFFASRISSVTRTTSATSRRSSPFASTTSATAPTSLAREYTLSGQLLLKLSGS